MKILANLLTVAAFVFLNGSTFVYTASGPADGGFLPASETPHVDAGLA